jgi:hypothetical protein
MSKYWHNSAKPVVGVDVRVVDSNNNDAADGQISEMALQGGWLCTGDSRLAQIGSSGDCEMNLRGKDKLAIQRLSHLLILRSKSNK